MAVRKRARRSSGGDKTNNSGESEFEARLTPPEEKAGVNITQSSGNDGTLAVNTGKLNLPQDLTEEEEKAHNSFPVDPFVFAILCFSLIFILIIAYIVWSGWEPHK